jgi:hypothetical protein
VSTYAVLVLFETLNRLTIEVLKLAPSNTLGRYVEICIELDTRRFKVDLFKP